MLQHDTSTSHTNTVKLAMETESNSIQAESIHNIHMTTEKRAMVLTHCQRWMPKYRLMCVSRQILCLCFLYWLPWRSRLWEVMNHMRSVAKRHKSLHQNYNSKQMMMSSRGVDLDFTVVLWIPQSVDHHSCWGLISSYCTTLSDNTEFTDSTWESF